MSMVWVFKTLAQHFIYRFKVMAGSHKMPGKDGDIKIEEMCRATLVSTAS